MYQGDPSHSANACSSLSTANVAALRPAWFVPTAGSVTDTPVVSGGRVYAGDYSGLVHALDEATGVAKWTFNAVGSQTCFLDAAPHADSHKSGFGKIPASPAVSTIAGRPTLFVAAGGSLFALDASTGGCPVGPGHRPGRPDERSRDRVLARRGHRRETSRSDCRQRRQLELGRGRHRRDELQRQYRCPSVEIPNRSGISP